MPTQDPIDQMIQTAKGASTQATSEDPIDAMIKLANNHQQAATLLGHATSQMMQSFQSPLQNIAAGQANTGVESLKGVGKQITKDIASTGAQNAGPVGADMTAHLGPQLQGAFGAVNQALQPSNAAQASGMAQTQMAEAAIPAKAIINTAEDSTSLLGKFLASRATKKATDAVASTAETMTKGERETAVAAGRLKQGIFSNSYAPSDTESRAGELLSGKVTGNAIKDVPIVQSEIATRGKEAEQFLADNAKPISNEEDFNAFSAQREKSATYLTPTAVKAYDEQMTVFQGLLKKAAEKEGGYNTSNYYKALKEYETNVTQNLPKGKEALLDEGGSARLQAAKDVRSVVRDMVGKKNPKFKGKMFDLASLYDARDNVITKAEKSGHSIQEFANKHPYLTGGVGALGIDAAFNKVKDWTGL